ncbi:hypothetical protein ACZ98_23410 (plasmid) [Vibrio parahaemolyticus]|nr:hypothetical protein ACZ98_23410 [Vibrio parahaemolyticus]
MTIKETPQSEIVVDPNQMSPVDQVTDKTQQDEDLQPKILAILDKIESNTSALLRREPRALASTSQAVPAENNSTKSVLKTHQINTNQVLVSSTSKTQVSKVSKGGETSHSSLQVDKQSSIAGGNDRSHASTVSQTQYREKQSELVQEKNSQAHDATVSNAKSESHLVAQTRPNGSTGSHAEQPTEKRVSTPRVAKANKDTAQSINEPAAVKPKEERQETPPQEAPTSTDAVSSKKPASNRNKTRKNKANTPNPDQANHGDKSTPDESSSTTASQQAQQDQKEKRDRSSLFKTVGDVFKRATEEREELEAGDTATDAAGSVVGGSLWEAAKEVKEAVDDVKGSSLGQKVIEKVTGNKEDDGSSDDSSPAEAVAKDKPKGPVRDENGRFIKRSEVDTSNQDVQNSKQVVVSSEQQHDSQENVRSSDTRNIDTNTTLDKYQLNTNKKPKAPVNSKDDAKVALASTHSVREGKSRESNRHKTSTTSANVVKEREKVKSNEAIADRLDEQAELSQSQHKELIKTIEKKESGGESGGSLMDSVSDLTDMFGGEGKEKGGKRRRGRGRKGRLGSLLDRFKGSKASVASRNATALKSAPTTKLGRVAQGVKTATGSLANTGVGKAAGGALKTVGSVASRAAAPVAALATGYFKYNEVKDREDLTGSQKAVQVGATTAGSLGGASAGAAMGAAMGSVVPVVGTLIGGLLGAAVGGWLGGKGGDIVGEAVSDKMEGTDGKTRAERELESAKTTHQSKETTTENSDKTELSKQQNASVQATATAKENQSQRKDSSTSTQTVQASEASVLPEQLKATLPEISPSKSALNKVNTKETRSEKIETVAKIDEKKLGKAIVDAMDKSKQQSGVSASSSGPRYAASQSKAPSVPAPIKTEFEDKTLVLMAHDRI